MDKTLSKQSDQEFESLLKERLTQLKELFLGPAWALYQGELGKLRRELVERAVVTAYSDPPGALRWLHQAHGLDMLMDGTFEGAALQDAGQPVDKLPEPEQYMSLDSADRRLLKEREKR